MFIELRLLKGSDIIKCQQLHELYSLPSDVQALFVFSSDVHSTNLQQNSGRISIIHIPSIKSVIYVNKSVKYHCAYLWNKTFGIAIDNNKINVAVKQIRNATQFKRLVNTLFI